MPIVDAGTSFKYGAYLADKSDNTTFEAFEVYRVQSEKVTGKKVCRIRTDGAFDTGAWKDYCQRLGIIHEITAPYSSSQNGLAERAIQTIIEYAPYCETRDFLIPTGQRPPLTPFTPVTSFLRVVSLAVFLWKAHTHDLRHDAGRT